MDQDKYTRLAENELLSRRFTSFQPCNGGYGEENQQNQLMSIPFAPERNLSLFAVHFASVFENDEGEGVHLECTVGNAYHALVVCHALIVCHAVVVCHALVVCHA